ncbi:MAG TPA: aldo/keto reductase [Candidatus Dormibacteraeota bacterium]|nr:aldo/keto reductase [Candidatus Dormibacteraeota bacterium]
MQYRRLGKSSLVVSAMGLGCMGMSQSYGPADEQESLATINLAIDRGITLLDTADMYGGGANEELLSKVLAKRRNEVVLATKFGNMRNPDGRFLGVNGKPEYVQEACEASLKRLKISTIDLLYLHRVDVGVPIEDTVGAMARLIQQGKVRYLGLSEAGAKTIRRAHATYPITALQSEYSIWTRDPEGEILNACRELGIGLVPYSPLGRGILTGKVKSTENFGAKDFRRISPRFQGENFEKNLQLVERVERIAAEKNCTPAQLALAWVMAQGPDVVPIPGTKRRTNLEQNLKALDVTLTPADLKSIDEAAPRGAAAGARYPDEYMNRLGV